MVYQIGNEADWNPALLKSQGQTRGKIPWHQGVEGKSPGNEVGVFTVTALGPRLRRWLPTMQASSCVTRLHDLFKSSRYFPSNNTKIVKRCFSSPGWNISVTHSHLIGQQRFWSLFYWDRIDKIHCNGKNMGCCKFTGHNVTSKIKNKLKMRWLPGDVIRNSEFPSLN